MEIVLLGAAGAVASVWYLMRRRTRLNREAKDARLRTLRRLRAKPASAPETSGTTVSRSTWGASSRVAVIEHLLLGTLIAIVVLVSASLMGVNLYAWYNKMGAYVKMLEVKVP